MEHTLTLLLAAASAFVFMYPLYMAYLWMFGAVYYYWSYERHDRPVDQPPELEYPPLSVVVPCYNEADNLHDTIGHALALDYPEFEVIAVNDGSRDDTGALLDAMALREPRLRVIHQATNQGKAIALNTALALARHDYLLCIDGDAVLDPHAAKWLMRHFHLSPRVGAVTGNPRIRNRSTLLGRLQVGEFAAIIGLIKRAQRTYGRLFTVSGVITAFRKSAVCQVGFWSDDMLTEDIDISWKLQLRHWAVHFEPRALIWILMPETLSGLWKQRLRWAQGGAQALLRHGWVLGSWKNRHMWPVYFEYLLSVVWSYLMLTLLAGSLLAPWLSSGDLSVNLLSLVPGGFGMLLGATCLLQFAVAMALDSRYDQGLGKAYYWMVWYPIIYWVINVCTTVVAFPRALWGRKGQRARWVSPDRGVKS